MCGTPLVLSGEYLKDESYLRHGHIAGFKLWTDIKGMTSQVNCMRIAKSAILLLMRDGRSVPIEY